MSNARQKEILRHLFAEAAEASEPPALAPRLGALDATHPVDDEDLLLDWSLGDLSRERREQLLDHLAACPPCRREIAAMIRAGALVLPHVAASLRDAIPVSERPNHVATHAPRDRVWHRPAVFTLVAALAASLLLFLARGLFDFGPPDRGSLIAMAQRDLEQGRPNEAFARLETYLSGEQDVSEDRRVQAAAILESSGYELARGGLVKGDFSQVSDVENRAVRRRSGSARLTNLRIQAERGETAEQSLARRRSLVRDYGYEPDGKRQIKDFSIPEIAATQRRVEAELVTALETYPDSLALRLNYAQFLLEQNDYPRAAAEFAAGVRTDSANPLPHTGLGLALFQQNRPETIARALEHFRKAVELSPDDPDVNLNLAVCLMRLGREADARPYFEKAKVDTKW